MLEDHAAGAPETPVLGEEVGAIILKGRDELTVSVLGATYGEPGRPLDRAALVFAAVKAIYDPDHLWTEGRESELEDFIQDIETKPPN